MSLSEKMTFKVVSAVLRKKSFLQTELAKETGVSWGRMNKIVQWLVKRGYVRKTGKYELISPGALISLLVTEVELEKKSFEIQVPPEKILSWAKKQKAVLCLSTALNFYSSYFRDPSINLYYSKELEEHLQNAEEGLTQVYLVKSSLQLLKEDVVKEKGFLMTDKIRTIIDLFADKKAYVTGPLLKKL